MQNARPQISSLEVPQAKVRHEWYQTEDEIVLSVFVKNTKAEDISCEFGSRSLSILYKLPTTGSEGCFDLDPLWREIDPESSIWKSLPSKIEVRLKKKERGFKWNVIERDAKERPEVVNPTREIVNKQSVYPSSSRRKTNWDEVAQAVQKEEEESHRNLNDPNAGGDLALNQLFQKLYADATDEQKRAMMKSYTESNGTALSTDWEDVKKKKVETKPPKSMVVKNWEK